MSRFWFLTGASLIAMGVGGTALLAPVAMLATKGIVGNAAAQVWMREVGALPLAVGVIGWLVRSHEDSATLRALLWGNAMLQLALLPIEVVAHAQGVIPWLIGIVLNTVLHILLAAGFVMHARAVRVHPWTLHPEPSRGVDLLDTTTTLRATIDTWSQAWSEPDEARRLDLLRQAAAPSCSYTDPNTEIAGHAPISAYMAGFQESAPRARFETTAFKTHHDRCIVHWMVGFFDA